MEKDGYTAVQLGAGTPKVKRVSKAMRGHYLHKRLSQSVSWSNSVFPKIT